MRKIARNTDKHRSDDDLNSDVAASKSHPGRPTVRLPRSLEELKTLIKFDD